MRRRHFLGANAGAVGLAGVSPALAQVAPRQRALKGLAISINDYAALTPLKTASQDALSVSQRLAGIGYDVIEVAEGVVDTDAVLDGFQAFVSQLDQETAAFVFMAGHGIQVEGRNYFLPANVPVLKDRDALAYALPIDNLLSSVARATPAQSIFVLDACRNSAIDKTLEGAGRGMASTQAPGGCFIAYSAGSGEYALDRLTDDDPEPNGLFTRHLVAELQAERPIYDVIAATRARVIPEAEAVGHAQHPAIYDQARRAYFVDGLPRRASEEQGPRAASIEGVGVVIAACDRYPCSGDTLAWPKRDAARLERVMREMGATVTVAANPEKQDLLDICRTMGEAEMRHLCFIWLGKGQLQEMQACGIMENAGCGAALLAGKSGLPAASLVSHSDVIKAFRPESLMDDGRKPAPLSLFLDIGLEREPLALSTGPHDAELPLSDLPNDFLTKPRFHDVSLLAATEFSQGKQADAKAQASSPFVTALVNALGRPGIRMVEVARLMQQEVLNLTDNAQSPRLFATRDAGSRIMVEANLSQSGRAGEAKSA